MMYAELIVIAQSVSCFYWPIAAARVHVVNTWCSSARNEIFRLMCTYITLYCVAWEPVKCLLQQH